MTLPLNLPAPTFEAVVLHDWIMTRQLLATPALALMGPHAHFTYQAAELRTALQNGCAKFDALLAERLVDAKKFRGLCEAAHEQAEEADALLIALVCCGAPEALIQEVETIFDGLRGLEEQSTKALERNKGLPRCSASDVTPGFSLERPTP